MYLSKLWSWELLFCTGMYFCTTVWHSIIKKIWPFTISLTDHRTVHQLRLYCFVLIGLNIKKGSEFILHWQTGLLLYESAFCSQSKRTQLALWDVLSKTVLWYHDSSGDFEQSMLNFWWMISQPATAQTVKVVNIFINIWACSAQNCHDYHKTVLLSTFHKASWDPLLCQQNVLSYISMPVCQHKINSDPFFIFALRLTSNDMQIEGCQVRICRLPICHL